MQINLTEQQIKNLIIFLNRVQLQGTEATTLVELVAILQQALKSEPKVETKQ